MGEPFIIKFIFNNDMNKINNSKVIRSSEISQYIYCPYAWWESRTIGMVETKEMAAGEVFHKDFMVKQDVARKLNVAGYAILIVIFILIMYYFFVG